MPLLVSAWLLLPVIAGFTLLPGSIAQIQLINLAAEGLKGTAGSHILQAVWIPALLYVFMATLRAVALSLKKMLNNELVARFTFGIQSDIVDCTMRVPMEMFEETEFHNRLARARAASNENLLEIFNRLSDVVQMFLNFVFILLVLRQGHWLIPVLALAVSLPALLLRLWIEIRVRRLNRDMTHEGRKADYLIKHIIKPNILKELRIFGAGDYLMESWRSSAEKQNNARGEMRRKEIKLGIFFTFLRSASIVISAGLLILGLQKGQVTAGVVAVVFRQILEAQIVSLRMAEVLSKVYILGAKACYIDEFLSTCELPSGRREGTPSTTAHLRLDRVSFRYPGAERPVLEDISFSIQPGETIALVGENGSGKTTLINLLLGLYRSTAGMVYWDGQDYNTLRQEELRERMSAVFQDFMRYELTLRENMELAGGNEAANTHRIMEVLEQCDVTGITDGTVGLDIPLGRVMEGGRELSGGQWQRLAIARAMYKDAEVVILDEPTAALDPNAELELFKQFRKLTAGKTVLLVSHRLGWARYADRILVLDKGRLIEEGTHEALMQCNGKYAQTFAAQAAWYA